MASRKEQKAALRREREERERQAQEAERRKRLVGYGVGGALGLAALVVVAVLLLGGGGGEGGARAELLPDGGEAPRPRETELRAAARAGGCELENERTKGRGHSTDLSERIEYRSNPPTSGKHFEIPAEDGAYGEAPRDEELVHTLEHGRVIIWFKPTLPEAARADLKAFFDEDTYQMVVVPRRDMPYAIAATAWNRDPEPEGTGRLLGCRRYSERAFDALRAFKDEHRSNGPEPVP
jgi:Protein of unknown function (DUF3105)